MAGPGLPAKNRSRVLSTDPCAHLSVPEGLAEDRHVLPPTSDFSLRAHPEDEGLSQGGEGRCGGCGRD